VVSHYQVDFEAVSPSYVVPVGIEDELAMDHVSKTSPTSCSHTLQRQAFVPLLFKC
jgi:hypothetical protein